MSMQTLPVKSYWVIGNNMSGTVIKTADDETNFEESQNLLIKMREELPHVEWTMVAVVDA